MDVKKVEDTPSAVMHEQIGTRTQDAVWQTRETYCKPGLAGIFASYYVALCAIFAALGGESDTWTARRMSQEPHRLL